jgi:hypothetical protein
MESSTVNKGGRPPAKQKRSRKLSTHCTVLECSIIEGKAKSANLSVSELLRKMTIDGEVIVKTYPKEILKITTQLSQIAANTHGIHKKLNFNQVLSFQDLEEIKNWSEEFKNLSSFIKETLK